MHIKVNILSNNVKAARITTTKTIEVILHSKSHEQNHKFWVMGSRKYNLVHIRK